jgi:hypothetical protein
MNAFESARRQVVETARRLLELIKEAEAQGSIDIRDRDGSEPPVDARDLAEKVGAIKRILSAHAQGRPFDRGDVQQVVAALSEPVRCIPDWKVFFRRRMVTSLLPLFSFARDIAQHLVTYLEAFQRVPALIECQPIGVCSAPGCGKLFLRRKADQICCGARCYERLWRTLRLATDPDYYRTRAREARRHRKRVQEVRAKRAQKECEHRRIAAETQGDN